MCCKSRITRVIYDLNHCAYNKAAGYNCKFVYKTVSIQRSFVFASGTPTPIVVDIFGESTITVVNKYVGTQLSEAKVDIKAREAYRAKIHLSPLSSS